MSGFPMVTEMAPCGAGLPKDDLLPPNMARSLPIALLRARESIMGPFRPILAARDLTEQQWRVVRVLAEQSPLDSTEVAARSTVLAPSLTRIVKSLEDRGLIRKQRDAGDGRRAMLSIAPAGIAMLRDITPEASALYRRIVRQFGQERVEELLDLLNDLAAVRLAE